MSLYEYHQEIVQRAIGGDLAILCDDSTHKVHISATLFRYALHQLRQRERRSLSLFMKLSMPLSVSPGRIQHSVEFCDDTYSGYYGIPHVLLIQTQVIIATGQAILSMMERGILKIEEIVLLLLDDCHKMVQGDHCDQLIAGFLTTTAHRSRLVAFASSPESGFEGNALPTTAIKSYEYAKVHLGSWCAARIWKFALAACREELSVQDHSQLLSCLNLLEAAELLARELEVSYPWPILKGVSEKLCRLVGTTIRPAIVTVNSASAALVIAELIKRVGSVDERLSMANFSRKSVPQDRDLYRRLCGRSEPYTESSSSGFSAYLRLYRSFRHATGYTFSDVRLLMDAMNFGTRACERLEFVGDGALELVSTSHWIKEHPVANLGKIDRSKQQADDLYRTPFAPVDQLLPRVPPCHRAMLASNQSGDFWMEVDYPKGLAGVMEAIFGAVYIDSVFDVSAVDSVFDRCLLPAIQRLVKVDVELEYHGVLSKNPSLTGDHAHSPTNFS
ncbi:MAG: hypothetical protein J3Q66DRAFT_387358 [Benniella sp.]|nr:MAG: hypothetical protein J3Q66DRAFT_387358 [Benniella sp.]